MGRALITGRDGFGKGRRPGGAFVSPSFRTICDAAIQNLKVMQGLFQREFPDVQLHI